MIKYSIVTIILFSFCFAIPIDLDKRYLKSTPKENFQEKIVVVKDRLDSNKFDLNTGFYLYTKLRDCLYFDKIQKLHKKIKSNEVFTVMFINYLSQTKCDISNIDFKLYLENENENENEIVIQVVLQLIGDKNLKTYSRVVDSIFKNTKNFYIKETIKNNLRKNGQVRGTSIPHLPIIDSISESLVIFKNSKIKSGEFPVYIEDFLDVVDSPVSKTFVAPHQSYGSEVRNAPGKAVYGNKHNNIFHVGVDSGWMLEGLPIHSISSGIVRRIQHESSWGTMVVIETLKENRDPLVFIYAHLSRLIDVKPGDRVYSGQVIGRIGNSLSIENGGYWAHTHIGIENSFFSDAKLTGYSSDLNHFTSVYDIIGR